MQITELLAQTGGLDSMARELGISEGEAARGAEALAPALLGGVKKEALAQPQGLGGLGDLLGQLGGGGLLDQVLSPQPTDTRQGDGVLNQIFGSRDVSRTVADDAATRSGLDASMLKRMLPMLAMLVAGYMAKQGGSASTTSTDTDGGLGGLLGGLLGGGSSAAGASGGLTSLLDANGDGNALDDILRMAGKSLR